jgi:hypothetical protein
VTSRLPIYFVDVFATRPLTGNPLSLVPDADGLDEARMRAIAREFNQSESTFLLRPSPRSSSSRATHWGGQAGSPCRFRSSAFASAAPAWSPRKEH